MMKNLIVIVIALGIIWLIIATPIGCEKRSPKSESNQSRQESTKKLKFIEEGVASYYADKFHGKPTASGELYDREAFSAAHKTLPFGTKVKVTRLDNAQSVIVRINDRGPNTPKHIIDLSYEAAKAIDLIHKGVANVKLEILVDE